MTRLDSWYMCLPRVIDLQNRLTLYDFVGGMIEVSSLFMRLYQTNGGKVQIRNCLKEAAGGNVAA